MSIWLVRAGNKGQYEDKFLSDKRIYLTWGSLDVDLKKYKNREKLLQIIADIYSSEKPNTIKNWASQIYPFAHKIQIDDWVVLPSKVSSTIHFGRVLSEYVYDGKAESPYKHYRDIEWFATDIPRNNFDQDLLYSFGAFMTVCQITRNDAEKRLRKMAKNNWKTTVVDNNVFPDSTDNDYETTTDIELAAKDAISKYILQKFKGYRMEELICELLEAKGFTVYHSKQGADGGKDLLASGGTMGFGSPKICVQVKTQDAPIERSVLDQLGGVMNKVGAEYGLLVSWNGFKSSVEKERGNQFFRIRLWDSTDVINELFANYEKLSPDLQADIPLKRIWMLNDEETLN